MAAMDRLENLNRTVIQRMEWIGFAGLLVMMCVTCIDVVGAKVFLRPVHGALDTVELAQLVAISFAAAATLIHNRHVQVEFLFILLPKRAKAVVDFTVQSIGLLLFIIIVWRLSNHGYYLQSGGEVSPTARIPLHPFAYGASLACIPVCIVFVLELVQSFSRMVRR
jgi:TRAP-type C4-dicarboxylate transport system permease small subunit